MASGFSIDPSAGLGSFTSTAASNGGGFLSSLGKTFNSALDTTLEYGLPQWLDYDYSGNAPGNGQWTNNNTDPAGIDPTLQRVANQRNNSMVGGNTGLYIALALAAVGVAVVLWD